MKKILKITGLTLVVALISLALCACIPNNPEKVQTKLEAKGYTVAVDDRCDDYATDGKSYAVKNFLHAVNYETKELITIYWFDKYAGAKAFVKDEDMEKARDNYSHMLDKEVVLKRNGKAVYVGTKQAFDDIVKK